jgi:signal transduction histidine kinase/ligand-binding sensor domain-containing protein/DNA-binding NarL/FixJ family response regulator
MNNNKTSSSILRLILLVFYLCLSLSIQSKDLFKVIENTSGLIDNSINCFGQDKHGFIWIGTANGLCRYDGLLFSSFLHNDNDPFSIVNSDVHKILCLNDGLLLSTDKGVDYYSFIDGHFYRCTIKNGRRNGQIRFKATNLILNGKYVFLTDGDGHMYVNEVNNFKNSFRRVNNKIPIYAINNYKKGLMLCVGSNGLYILSEDGSRILGNIDFHVKKTRNLNIYYSKNAKLVYVVNGIGQPGLAFKIYGSNITKSATYVPSNVMSVIDYRSKTLFGIDGGGIVWLEKGKVGKITPNNSNLSGDAIYTLFNDNSNNLWIGTYRAGVCLYSNKYRRFSMLDKLNNSLSYNIVTAVVTSKNDIYIGLDGGGLNIYNKVTKKTRVFNTANSGIAGNNVISLLKDGNDIWMAIYTKGLAKYSTATSKFSIYNMPSAKNGDENNVWTICDDGLGHIWVGGPNVYVFNKKTKTISQIHSLAGIDCSSIQRKGNYIWIGSSHLGVYKVDRQTYKIVKHYTSKSKDVCLPNNEVRYVFVDSHGKLWISIPHNGLYSIDECAKIIKKYDYNNGLTNTSVTSIAEDRSGMLWIGTFNGLFRYDPITELFVRFDEDEDIASVFTYNSSVFYGNKIYMGSLKGLVTFNPSLIHYKQLYKQVSITSLNLINNNNKKFNFYGIYNPKVELDYEQNFFTINFSVPEFDAPNRIHFSCYLKGLENCWRELSGAREVSYTNVPPGKYDFYVRCTDSNGHWVKPAVLHIVITPPWWKTTWAIVLWFVFIITLFFSAFKFYLYELEIKHNMRINEIEKDTMKKLNDAKMTFYTNIIHELRTPVFLISAQIEELLDIKKSIVSVPSSYLYAMYRSSAKLNKLISRIIDFRKLDSDKLKLALQRMNVVAFCENLIEDFTNLCEQKNISFNFVCDKSDIQLEFDIEKLEMIISNLVSNAFKYTKEGGSVTLAIEEQDDKVLFSVKDNGIGIVEKMRDTIFESFFRSERAEKQSTGDGIGLSVVKSFVELHGGFIKVDSNVGKGSNFIFSIPKNINENGKYIKQDLMPFEIEDNIEPKPIQPQLPENPMATHTILIIDDEQQTVDLLERNLISDFKVCKAYDGIEGLKQAEKVLPDIIICDIMMPNMDGLQFLTKLKSDKKLSNIKVLIFTAKTSEEDMLTAFDNGADAYITKPISLKVLRKRIDHLIEQTDNAKLTNSITEKDNSYTKEEQIFLLKCREIIDDNINNDDFNIDFFADKLAMSHSSLYKKIKQMTGMSLIEFINDYKIYKSVQLFKQGLTNIESVCEKCGFKDVKNFREMFKRKMKITPKQYVQSL